jgi:hypothetical protein
MTDDRLLCQSCNNPKRHLDRVNSRITGWPLNMCLDCIQKKFEPRWLIILAVRQTGRTPLIDEYIKLHRYVGEQIPAVDVL